MKNGMSTDSEGQYVFWGQKINKGETLRFNIEEESKDSDAVLHLRQIALGPTAKAGRHTVMICNNPVGTLELGKCEQFSVDYSLKSLDVSHTGGSTVFVSGYINKMPLMDAFNGDFDDDDDDEDDDEQPPEPVPVRMIVQCGVP